MDLVKFSLLVLLIFTFTGCSAVKESDVPGKYQIVKPGYLAMAKYVITDRILGYRMGQRKLIFNPDHSHLILANQNDTITGTWKLTPDHKIQTTVNWNDSTYQDFYAISEGKLSIVYITFLCEDRARIKPRKSLTVYEKMKE